MTRGEAAEIVRKYLRESYPQGDLIVYDEALEYEFGWVFFYNSRKFVETGNILLSLVGNAPILLEGTTGRMLFLGTAEPLETYIDAYRRTGDPHARPSRFVRIEGWREGANTVAAIRAVHHYSGARLPDAKHGIESAMDGSVFEVDVGTVESAAKLVRELEACGFVATHEGRY